MNAAKAGPMSLGSMHCFASLQSISSLGVSGQDISSMFAATRNISPWFALSKFFEFLIFYLWICLELPHQVFDELQWVIVECV